MKLTQIVRTVELWEVEIEGMKYDIDRRMVTTLNPIYHHNRYVLVDKNGNDIFIICDGLKVEIDDLIELAKWKLKN